MRRKNIHSIDKRKPKKSKKDSKEKIEIGSYEHFQQTKARYLKRYPAGGDKPSKAVVALNKRVQALIKPAKPIEIGEDEKHLIEEITGIKKRRHARKVKKVQM